jgi:hypothetical protein
VGAFAPIASRCARFFAGGSIRASRKFDELHNGRGEPARGIRMQTHGNVDRFTADCFAPGEKRWHGASPTIAMTHIAIQEKLDGLVAEGYRAMDGRRAIKTLLRPSRVRHGLGVFFRG